MYDLSTRGRLEIRSFSTGELVRVVAEDVSVGDAFALVTPLREEDLASHPSARGFIEAWDWSFYLVPHGVTGDDGWLVWQDGDSDIVVDGEMAGVDHFTYGDELSWDDPLADEHGFALAVWADGVTRNWWPMD